MEKKANNHPNLLPGIGVRQVSLCSALFIWYAVWANVSGWLLSAIGFLTTTGYVVMLFPLIFGIIAIVKQSVAAPQQFTFFSRRRIRFSEVLFLVVIAMSFVGAIMNEPFGWDACAYRLPRVQRWLVEQRWCWLNSADDRMDISAVAYEWMMAPVLSLIRTDRVLFLINLIPYALLPGLIFEASRMLRLSRRWSLFFAAIIPFGYCYALQAASLQNDGITSFFGLSAIVIGCSRSADWLSKTWRLMLCVSGLALMSGIKITCLPIAGVLGIWFLWKKAPNLKDYLKRPFLLILIVIIASVCSIIPISIANQIYSGSWSGDPNNHYRHNSKNLGAALIANTLFLCDDSMTPNPFAGKMNAYLAQIKSEQSSLFHRLTEVHPNFEFFRFTSYGYEGASGFGAPLLMILGVMIISLVKNRGARRRELLYVILVVTAYGVYMAKVAVHGSQRHAAGYYPFLLIAAASVLRLGSGKLTPLLMKVAVASSGLAALAMILISPLRVMLPCAATDWLDSKGASFTLHREATSGGATISLAGDRAVWYVLPWGGVYHRLYAPYHSGKVIELGSRDDDGHKLSGSGLLWANEKAIQGRFGLSVEEFLAVVGQHTILGIDVLSSEDARKEIAGTLYEIQDMGKLPPYSRQRLRPR